MPIHLRPISRREFLARSAAAGAGLVFGRSLLAASKSTDADSWALLADIHIAADRHRLHRGINMADHLVAVVQELAALPKRPSGVIVAGDLAFDTGEAGDYTTLSDLIKPLRVADIPVHLLLGNHDNRENFWTAFNDAKSGKRPMPDRHVAIVRAPRANWFLLDSLDKTLSVPGELGQAQLDWLAKSLDASKTKPALLVAHHNLGQAGNIKGLKDTEALLEVIRPRKQVKAWIHGHTHAWKVEQDESGLHLVNLPPVAYVFKEGEPSGWVHATLERHGMRLELRCLNEKHPAHGQIVNLKWRTG